ncbi:MAG: MerR family transcriptional regulator [Micrococcales bacterium]|nr:MerR family transcriptional regulator [Micrococcales bacterium]
MSAEPQRVVRPAAARPTAQPETAQPREELEPWPQGISRRATMRISDALAALRVEFPTMTPSRLRFLEDQGLVHPVRTPAGYRQYSPADVERLRYVLRQQRDRYLPLRVIAEQLAALDAGQSTEPVPRARLATRDGVSATRQHWSVTTLAADAGVSDTFVADLVDAGVLRPGPRGIFEAGDLEVVHTAVRLAQHGIDPRHLRAFRAAADRQVALVEQVVAPLREQKVGAGTAKAGALAAELGELCAQMHTALLRSAVAHLA